MTTLYLTEIKSWNKNQWNSLRTSVRSLLARNTIDSKQAIQIARLTVDRFKKLIVNGYDLPHITNRRDLTKYLYRMATKELLTDTMLLTHQSEHALNKLTVQEAKHIEQFLSESDKEVLRLVVKQYNFTEILLASGLSTEFVRYSLKRILDFSQLCCNKDPTSNATQALVNDGNAHPIH